MLYKAFADQVGLAPAVEGLFVAVRAAMVYAGPQLELDVLGSGRSAG